MAPAHSFPSAPSTKSLGSTSPALSLGSAKTSQQFSEALDQAVSTHPGLGIANSLRSLATQVGEGKVIPSSVYLPNLNLLESGTHTPGQNVGIGYTANPAPMGIGDFGLETGTPEVQAYTYSTPSFAGSFQLTAANASYPGAYYYIGTADGGYTSPYNFGIQLNTVTTNISIPGDNEAAMWTQNVVTVNGDTIGLEDNVWNFTSSTGALYPGTILSGDGIGVYPTFYYDYGPTFPQAFPLTIDLYNNASVVAGHDQVTFGYRIVSGTAVHTGIYDTVVFNNTGVANPHPSFEVSGSTTTPLGLNWDSELIFGGPGGGSNAVFNNISGTETLQYWNSGSTSYKSVPSAYDFGADTGETAIGVAETWSPGGTVGLSAGPSLLYGLWNSQVSTEVASGSIEVQGTLATPDWGFVFIGDGGPYYNQSYVPTTATGGFLTYLPPVNAVFPYTGHYLIFYLADGYTYTYVAFTASTVGISEVLTTNSGQWAEPLYVNGNAQAQSAFTELTGWTAGHPYTLGFADLLSGLSSGYYAAMFFNHLNDWGYVTFNMLQATDVTNNELLVGILYQGYSEYGGTTENNYFMDGPLPGSTPTLLGTAPAITSSLLDYGQLIAFYSCSDVNVTDENLYGYFAGSTLTTGAVHPFYSLNPAGGAVVLWNVATSNITYFNSYDGSYGVYIADSTNVGVYDGSGNAGANGVSLVGANHASVYDVEGANSVVWTNNENNGEPTVQVPYGVYDAGSVGGTFGDLEGYEGGVGFAGFGSVGAVLNDVYGAFVSTNVSDESLYYSGIGTLLAGALDTSINDTGGAFDGIGVADGVLGPHSSSWGTTITNVAAFLGGVALLLVASNYTNVTNLGIDDTDIGGELVETQNTSFWGTNVDDVDLGLEVFGSANTTFDYTNVTDLGVGLYFEDAYASTLTNFNASDPIEEVGAYFEDSFDISLNNIVAWDAPAVYVEYGGTVTANHLLSTDDAEYALDLYGGFAAKVSHTTVNEDSQGVDVDDWTDATLSYVATTGEDSTGFYVDPSSGVTISGLNVTDYSFGGEVFESSGITVSNVAVTNDSEGVELDEVSQATVTTLSADTLSWGLDVDESDGVDVSAVTVSNESIGAYVDESDTVSVWDVVATDSIVYSPTVNSSAWDLPIGAIVAYGDEALTIWDVTATTYPAAVIAEDSDGLVISAVTASDGFYGIQLEDVYESTITGSTFTDQVSYAVDLIGESDENLVYYNNFIGNNGATGTYNSGHIQAYSSEYNDFYECTNDYCTTGVGNYWSDWHTYGSNGYLAPYPITGEVSDLFPIGPQEMFTVAFVATGLALGTNWSVTLGGVTHSATSPTITISSPVGNYSYQVPAVAGYTASPTSGSVSVTANYTVDVAFSADLYAVTLSAGGLSTSTTWSATVNGATQSTSGTSLVFDLPAGKYTYAFNSVSGYNLPSTGASGTVNVTNAPVAVATTYSPTSTPSYVQTSDFDDWLAVAIAIAAVALVIGLLAVFLHRRKQNPPQQGAQPWTPPASAAESAPPAGAGSAAPGWSEGPPPSGETPPPSS